MKIGGTARGLAARLAELPIEQAGQEALAAAAEQLAQRVRAALSTPAPAAGEPSIGHEAPWRRTGELRDGISVQVDGNRVRVVSAGKAARAQEFGTVRVPPRPVLGPAAAAQGQAIADAVGQAVAELLR